MPPTSPPQRKCIFCPYEGKLTDEHIWGDWTRDYIPRLHKKHDFADIRVPQPGVHDEPEVRIRAGDPLNAQVRVVCARCNSGWMSQIQERAKPLLIPLFKGEPRELDAAAQTIIATWITMATITSEHISRNSEVIVTTRRDRKWLMRRGMPPYGWRIWLGHYKRQSWVGQWVRTTGLVLKAEDIPRAVKSGRPTPNEQATTFIVGELYVSVLNGAHADITALWDWRTDPRALNSLVQIWPIVRDPVPFGLVAFGDDEAKSFSTAFRRWSDDIARKNGFVDFTGRASPGRGGFV